MKAKEYFNRFISSYHRESISSGRLKGKSKVSPKFHHNFSVDTEPPPRFVEHPTDEQANSETKGNAGNAFLQKECKTRLKRIKNTDRALFSIIVA